MYQSHLVNSVSGKEPEVHEGAWEGERDSYLEPSETTVTEGFQNDTVHTPLNSTTGRGQNRPDFESSILLRSLSLGLHCLLVVIHLILLGVWANKLENHVVFSLEHQTIVSFFITAVTQTFGTLYSAVLVFITQTLSMRRSLTMKQPLTATHDNNAAWTGIGSAVLRIWHQRAIRASLTVITVALYLATILVLHITTPALFSLEVFNGTRSAIVGTQGLPAFNISVTNGANWFNLTHETEVELATYATGSLSYLPYVDGAAPVGLQEGTLYDVLTSNEGVGNISVSATGFNITCGYPEMASSLRQVASDQWVIILPDEGSSNLFSTQPGIIVNGGWWRSPNYTDFYSTIPIIDSSDNLGGFVGLNPPMNTSVSSIQVFRCFQSVVQQTALVNASSGRAMSIGPEFKKTTSTWLLSDTIAENIPPTDGSFWAAWYDAMPKSDFPLDASDADADNVDAESSERPWASAGDMYLIKKLRLVPSNYSEAPSNVTLHDLENALSELVAAMFWTRHVPPTDSTLLSPETDPNAQVNESIAEVPSIIFLTEGTVLVPKDYPQAQLDLSIIAISVGLAASIALLVLSLPDVLYDGGANGTPIQGTGLLHAIWLYRNHPELHTLLEQVQEPTNDNLRRAGMVRTRLVGGNMRKRERSPSL
ncbi:hypothetical protein B0H19DRAFT_1377089 [Mycena capillaripes]|nr:hypothetical protein B0H19DRAFT_1377089 [Mycena capillaripes]